MSRLLDELSADLEGERWRPLPARRVWIPKPGVSEQRPLSIPAVRDRIVQAAVKIVIEPIFEADFAPDHGDLLVFGTAGLYNPHYPCSGGHCHLFTGTPVSG